jgi:hypothetical protein
MYVYKYTCSRGYELINCVDRPQSEAFGELNGEPRTKRWEPVRVRRARQSLREGFRPSDSPFAAYCLVFRRSAVDALRDILDAHGELLPLEDEGGVELFAYNPRALEALDHERTVGSRDEDGRVYSAGNHVFIPSVVEGVDVFRQVQKGRGNVYFSDRFIQRWKQAKLKGLDFILAWDSDLPPEAQPNVNTSKPIKL